MSNGINFRQNEEKSIAMLAAQRKLYNDAAMLDALNFIMLVILPLIFTAINEMGAKWSGIRYFSYSLSLVMILLSDILLKKCKEKKLLASSIQLAFDVYVFNMPWDKRLFGDQRDLNFEIVSNSNRILADCFLQGEIP